MRIRPTVASAPSWWNFALCVLAASYVFAAPKITINQQTPFTEECLESIAWDGRSMFVGCDDEHVYVSTDKGKSWQESVMKGVDGSVCALLCTSDGAVIGAANSWDDHFIGVSTDRGATWHREWRDGDIMVKTLVELGKGTVIALGDESQYVRSVAGTNYVKWQEPDRPWVKKGGLFADIDVQDHYQFANGDILLVGESAFTICYDQSFTNHLYGCARLIEEIDYTAVHFANDTVGCVGSDDGPIFRTTNRGKNWTLVYHGSTHINDIAFDGMNGGIAVGQKGLLLVSADNGSTWALSDSGVYADLNFVEYIDDGRFVVGGEDGQWMFVQF
jgi:photosystem II stability/assembly factor-like uncharacterized protein